MWLLIHAEIIQLNHVCKKGHGHRIKAVIRSYRSKLGKISPTQVTPSTYVVPTRLSLAWVSSRLYAHSNNMNKCKRMYAHGWDHAAYVIVLPHTRLFIISWINFHCLLRDFGAAPDIQNGFFTRARKHHTVQQHTNTHNWEITFAAHFVLHSSTWCRGTIPKTLNFIHALDSYMYPIGSILSYTISAIPLFSNADLPHPPRQNGHLFADDNFRCIFLKGNVSILIKISLKCVPVG